MRIDGAGMHDGSGGACSGREHSVGEPLIRREARLRFSLRLALIAPIRSSATACVDCGIEERNGGGWMDFEVRRIDEAALLRLYERLPDAERYESDGYRVYEWLRITSMWQGRVAQ